MTTLILVIIVISLLILVHEWGHFYSARKLGVRVEEFGFGFPPKVFSKVRKGIRYSLNLFPFGGFVKIFGEHGEGENDPKSFMSRPAWQRFIILAAGVFMNFVLAWVFFSVGATLGVPTISDDDSSGIPVSVIGISHGSPAEKAGLRFGDKILEMKAPGFSLRIESEKDIRDFVDAYRGEEIVLMVGRGDEIKEVKVVPRVEFPEGEGPLGVAIARLTVNKVPFYLAPIEGARTLFFSTRATASGLFGIAKEFFTEGKTSADVSGPVGIFFFADDTRTLGIAYFLQFIGLLSVNLAILNFLPIPALDGGRILFLAIEKVKGSRVDPRIENLAHTIGFALLILLMVLVTYKDVARIL